MYPRIEALPETKLIGKRLRMSLTQDRTPELFRSFKPRQKEVQHAISPDVYDVQIYGEGFDFKDFRPDTPFEKWAAVAVSAFEDIPEDMEGLVLPAGLYAVFLHKGPAYAFKETFSFIYQTWLPDSGYVLDDRPHFDVMGEKYIHHDPTSEEEIWVPVKKRI